MIRLGKTFALLLTLIIALSCLALLTAKPVDSQITPKPSVPTFTLVFVNESYSVTDTDPYTGLNTTQQIQNNSIVLTIKNQPLHYSDSNQKYQLYYNVQTKGHFESNWTDLYPLSVQRLTNSPQNSGGTYSTYIFNLPSQSTSDYTILSFPANDYPSNGTVDFEVEAIVGHNSQYWSQGFLQGGSYEPAIAYDSSSGWSTTQTITIPANSVSPSPTVPEFFGLVIVPLLLSVFTVAVLVRHRKPLPNKRILAARQNAKS